MPRDFRKGEPEFQKQSQKLKALLDVEEEEKLRSKVTPEQTRGATNVYQDKCRICLEARQVVLSYFDHNQDPVGLVIPSILTIQGGYARTGNIRAYRKWINDETFYIGN